MCGSSYQPITRSGPVLRFAAIAALARTSSQVMYSMLTLAPVASSNFFEFWFHASSSALMKPLQRKRRSCASFSTGNIGLYLSCCCANERVAAAARLPSPNLSTVRRRRPIGSLQSARQIENQVEDEGEDGRVVQERHGGVQKHGAPDLVARDLHVGDLEAHSYREREVGEIHVARVLAARKSDAADALVVLPVVEVRVPQCEGGMRQRPRERHGPDAERGEERLGAGRHRGRLALQEDSRAEADGGGQDH